MDEREPERQSETARAPRNPNSSGTRKRWFLAAIVVLVLALITLRLALPELVRESLNKQLADLNDYNGHIENIDLHLWRGAISAHGVEVVMNAHEVPVPFIDAEVVHVSVSWADLWQGAIVAEVGLQAPVVNFVDTRYDTDQTGEGTDWRQTLQDLVPIEINRIEVVDGRIHFRNFISEPPVDLEISTIQASVVNLTNADRSGRPRFAELDAEGLVVNDAPMELSARLDPLGGLRDFQVRLRVSDLDLTRLNALTRAYGAFDFESGQGSLIMELEAENAQLSGYMKPLLDDVKILDLEKSAEERGVLGAIWEGVVAGLAWAFRNHPEDRLGAQVEISGNLDQRDVSVWQAFVSVLRNAFVEAYGETFERE